MISNQKVFNGFLDFLPCSTLI
ncbi:hypothetical protein F383_22322 [Gossypium arboreum]|uniref:Uncharacterized protein n=1 Tax=Gossypium arboreum TaxID=29729 RepID=A0A0B0NY82_GOSAR|nr:hypothetical protein F383_22322 [Gossypium arboreum]